MTYFILLVLGLTIGAVFLIVLLIGDWREARLTAEKKVLQKEIQQASQPQENVWPPPPNVTALPETCRSTLQTTKQLPSGTNRRMVYTFFRYRNYALGTIFVGYFIYSCFPKSNFGLVLLATGAGFAVLATVMTRAKKARNRLSRSNSAQSQDNNG